ncbi:MAG TPA: lasso peptide biosynthesis B2 protein [Xanthobacteraceae bacterium]|nr:lasso peptide biosynthesis B2 protein [Xanthobacteraceae bacterium]
MKPQTLRRKLRIEALVAVAIAGLAVRAVSARRLLDWAARPPRYPRRFANPDLPELVAAAVNWAASARWVNAACLSRALAAQAMLRRRGIASRLCLGVARDGKLLSAHAWVEIGGGIIVGETAQGFARIAQFG